MMLDIFKIVIATMFLIIAITSFAVVTAIDFLFLPASKTRY